MGFKIQWNCHIRQTNGKCWLKCLNYEIALSYFHMAIISFSVQFQYTSNKCCFVSSVLLAKAMCLIQHVQCQNAAFDLVWTYYRQRIGNYNMSTVYCGRCCKSCEKEAAILSHTRVRRKSAHEWFTVVSQVMKARKGLKGPASILQPQGEGLIWPTTPTGCAGKCLNEILRFIHLILPVQMPHVGHCAVVAWQNYANGTEQFILFFIIQYPTLFWNCVPLLLCWLSLYFLTLRHVGEIRNSRCCYM